MRLLDIFSKGLAIDVLLRGFAPKTSVGNSSFLHKVVALILRVFFSIQFLKYLAIGVMFAGCLAINEIQSLFGLVEKEEVYVKSATSVNCFVDSAKKGFEEFWDSLNSKSEDTSTNSDEIARGNTDMECLSSGNEYIFLCNQEGLKNTGTSKNGFRYNNEDRGQSLVDIIKAQKEEQSLNMTTKALGSYKAKRLHR